MYQSQPHINTLVSFLHRLCTHDGKVITIVLCISVVQPNFEKYFIFSCWVHPLCSSVTFALAWCSYSAGSVHPCSSYTKCECVCACTMCSQVCMCMLPMRIHEILCRSVCIKGRFQPLALSHHHHKHLHYTYMNALYNEGVAQSNVKVA